MQSLCSQLPGPRLAWISETGWPQSTHTMPALPRIDLPRFDLPGLVLAIIRQPQRSQTMQERRNRYQSNPTMAAEAG